VVERFPNFVICYLLFAIGSSSNLMESSSPHTPSWNWKELEEQFRRRPLESALVSVLLGLLLSLSPIRGLISLAFRLVLFALKPALLIFGGLKLYEYIKQRSEGSVEKH
jgi:hypothetical protein